MKKDDLIVKLFDNIFNNNYFKEMGYNYSKGEMGTLFYLMNNNGCNQTSISSYLGFSMPRTTKILNELESKGLIIKAFSSVDRRKSIIILTENGKNLVLEKKNSIMNFLDKVFDYMSFDEINDYIRLSNKFGAVCDNLK